MRIVKSQKLTKQKKLGLTLVFPLIILTFFLGGFAFIYLDISSLNQELEQYYWWYNEDCAYTGERAFKDFYTKKVDWNFFEERAHIYENWADEYSIAKEDWDCATTIIEPAFEYGMISPFTDYEKYQEEVSDFLNNPNSKFRIIASKNPYHRLRDSPIWTGTYMTSLAFHYAEACEKNDVTEINDVLNKLKKPVDGFHLLTHVSGIDGNLARWAVKDTPENRERFEAYFYKVKNDNLVEREANLDDERYRGQGNYSDWVYIDNISRDQHIGFFMGQGITYKILTTTGTPSGINEALKEEIIETIKKDCLKTLNCIMGTNWEAIAGESELGEGRANNGASFNPRIPWQSGGDYLHAFTCLGKMMDPEKYTKYFNEVINRFLTTSYHFSVAQQSTSYYGNNLAVQGLILSYFLEEDPNIKTELRRIFNENLYEYVQFHRNSWFNLLYLAMNEIELNDILNDQKLLYRLDDITDNLYRITKTRFPARQWHVPRPDDYEDLIHPRAKEYHEIFQEDSNHPCNILYGSLIEEFSTTGDMSRIALGADEMKGADFVWQKSPFNLEGYQPDDEDYLGYVQSSGVDYTLCYWMGRYYGYFNA